MNIDHELHDALRRKEAPRDLADRVLQRIGETPAPSLRPAPSSSRLRQGYGAQGVRRWLAAAAVLAVAAGGAERYYTQQQQAAETARVREELKTALRITNDALAHVRSKLSPPAENGSR